MEEINLLFDTVFNYPKDAHNFLKVNGTGFQQCVAPNGTLALTSGNDIITLATSGKNGKFVVNQLIVSLETRSLP